MDLPASKLSVENLKGKLGDRINHILFTFSIGLVLAKFCELDKKIGSMYSKYFENKNNVFYKVWLITSLYHDYGYFLFNLYSNVKSISEFNVENIIFEYGKEEIEALKLFGFADEEKSRYTKDLFNAYFEGVAAKNNINEPFEHGIAGGVVLFDDIIKYNNSVENKNKKNVKKGLNIQQNDINSNYFYQNICYRIMEHNIWTYKPSSNFFDTFDKARLKEIDEKNYKLIDETEPLLYLLSLVDTIEFIKRMSTTSLDDPNAQSRPSTLSNKIKIEIDKNHIVIDTRDTRKVNGYDGWIEPIVGLKEWIKVNSSIDDYIIKIEVSYKN